MMRRITVIILLHVWFGLPAQAKEVVSTGYGKTVAEALQNAKVTAVEQVAGTFIVGKATAEGNTYHSQIDQYNGGFIARHTVLSTRETGGLIEVVIRADVDTDKVNSVLQSSGAELPVGLADKLAKSRDDYEKTRQIVAAVDDVAKAFVVQVGEITYTNRGDLTDVVIQLQIVYSPKWYDDVHVMAKSIGREVETSDGLSNGLWAVAALSAVVSPGLPGTLFSLARRVEKPSRESNEYMACFSRDNATDVDACYEIRHSLKNAIASRRLKVSGSLWLGERVIPLKAFFVDTAEEMFKEVDVGQRMYFTRSAKQRIFKNPGILLFRNGVVKASVRFTGRTDEIVKKMRVEFAVN